jgi:NAD(P)-dependent dehydrogenase (short-subunit alcohol dehydrogenase family)
MHQRTTTPPMLETIQLDQTFSPPNDALAGRVVLVTGAGQGLGRAAANAFAAHGAHVVLLGRTIAKLESVYDDIAAADLPLPALMPIDLMKCDQAQLDAIALSIKKELGRLDGIFHAASAFATTAPLHAVDLAMWEQQTRLHLNVPAALTKACMPLLKRAPDASVVFLSETHAVEPRAYWGGFATAKAALAHLVAVWSDEADNIAGTRFNLLLPGPVESPMRRKSHPAEAIGTNPSPKALASGFVQVMAGLPTPLRGKLIRL